MDTAQRGMGLDWPDLARADPPEPRSGEGSRQRPRGCAIDRLRRRHRPSGTRTRSFPLDDVIAAYEQQIEAIEGLGGRIILMASRALAACARSPDDYATVYDRILGQVREPVDLHWLGEMFDPALAG